MRRNDFIAEDYMHILKARVLELMNYFKELCSANEYDIWNPHDLPALEEFNKLKEEFLIEIKSIVDSVGNPLTRDDREKQIILYNQFRKEMNISNEFLKEQIKDY